MPLLSTVTIAINASVSSSFEVRYGKDFEKLLVVLTGAWTAANLKLQFSLDSGSNWHDVEADGSLLKIESIPTAGGGALFAPENAQGIDYWAVLMNNLNPAHYRLVSIDTADDTNENQLAARTIYIYNSYKREQLF